MPESDLRYAAAAEAAEQAIPAAGDSPNRSPIFIGGAGRSGTTLLRVILDSHSHIACGPEIKVLPTIAGLWADFQTKYAAFLSHSRIGPAEIDQAFRGLVLSLLEPLRKHEGKARIAEKSPNNVFYFPHLHRIFPDATFLHMIRDGRDVVASLLTMNWVLPDGTRADYTRDARQAARYWARAVLAGRAFAQHTAGSARYREIRYEELIARPEPSLRALFAYLDETWEPAVLRYYERPHALASESSAEQVARPMHGMSIGRWQTQLTKVERGAVKDEIGSLLLELRYCTDLDW
jgi:hypothetical protein